MKRVMLIGALLSTSPIAHAGDICTVDQNYHTICTKSLTPQGLCDPQDIQCEYDKIATKQVAQWSTSKAKARDDEIAEEIANAKPQVYVNNFIPDPPVALSDKIIPKIIADAYQCRLNNVGCDTINERIDEAKANIKLADRNGSGSLMYQLNTGINGHIDYDPTLQAKVAAQEKQNEETGEILCEAEQKQLKEVYSREARFDGTRNYVVEQLAGASKYITDFGVRNLQITSRGKTPTHTCAEALKTATNYMLHDPDTD